jgi:hypothetical protein
VLRIPPLFYRSFFLPGVELGGILLKVAVEDLVDISDVEIAFTNAGLLKCNL